MLRPGGNSIARFSLRVFDERHARRKTRPGAGTGGMAARCRSLQAARRGENLLRVSPRELRKMGEGGRKRREEAFFRIQCL